MKKHLLLLGFLLNCTVLPSASWITNADDITEAWLLEAGQETGYTEHTRHFKNIFSKMKVRTFLEFGVGFSTKFFLDNCDHVVSVEFVTPGSGPEWLQKCIELYRNCHHWTPIAYFSGPSLDMSWAPHKFVGTESVYKAASYQPVYRKSYAPIDSSFLGELDTFVRQQVAKNDVDVAFVDAGICIRGDLVQTLFHKVPIIAAHDIAPKHRRHDDDVYGYGRLVVPENYEEIYVPFGMGTAFWIKKEPRYKSIITCLRKYVNSPNPS